MQMCSQVATLPLGCSFFERLRQEGCIYVDKTDIVCRLAETSGKYLLTRPHLFGKSLLISTFESLFRYGLRDFAGLKIQKLWKDDFRANKVVRLDFSRVKVQGTFSDFCSDLENFLEAEFGKIGFCRNGPKLYFFNEFSNFLSTLPVSSLVLLIDDSDGPLISSLGDEALFKSVQRKLNEFYAILKSNDHAMRFLFLTGTTLLNKANEFGGLNDLYDLSLDPAYGSLLGYSREEMESCFSEFICRACTVLGMERKTS